MGHSGSETEFKKRKKKHGGCSDSDSGDEKREGREERKERRDREKEERKAMMDREKEERDREKEERKARMDREKEERKARVDREKEERKAKVDREKEERKERKDKEKEERDREKEERKKHKEDNCRHGRKEDKHCHGYKHDNKPSHQSGSGFNTSGGLVDVHDGKPPSFYTSGTLPEPPKSDFQPAHPSQSGEVPWFLRETDTDPLPNRPPLRPDFSIQSPPPQYSHRPPSQEPTQIGAVPPVHYVPPSGYRIPLDPNAQFPSPDRLGLPPTTDSDNSTLVFIGSAIFPNSVHPCKIIPSLSPPCRVLYNGTEVEHRGRYDLLPTTEDMQWVPSKNGEIPPGRRPVEGGYESNGSKLYHALGLIRGVHVPGETGQHLGGARLPVEGRECILQDQYSILCWK